MKTTLPCPSLTMPATTITPMANTLPTEKMVTSQAVHFTDRQFSAAAPTVRKMQVGSSRGVAGVDTGFRKGGSG